MKNRNVLSQRWRNLSITTKFSSAFGLLLILILLVSLTSYGALTLVRRQTETAILTSTEIQHLVLEMDAGLQKARRLERDFFLRYPTIGFSQARQTYAQQASGQIDEVMVLSAQLQQLISESDVSDALSESNINLNLYLSASSRYAIIFAEAVELVAQLAADEADKRHPTGLYLQLAQKSAGLRDMLQTVDDPELIILYREMQAFEKDYLAIRQRPLMQTAFNVAFLLRQAIETTPGLEEYQKAQVLADLDAYQLLAEEILGLDVAIRSKTNEFDLQAEAIDPITAELVTLANDEVERTRTQIDQTSRLVTVILVVITLLGLMLASLVAIMLNNSITRNIVKLTQVAGELQAGNLGISAHTVQVTQIDSTDELGQLAASFNMMAARINALVDDLEQQVAARTHKLETVATLSERLNAILDVEQLLSELVNQVKKQFNYYHVQLYLLDTGNHNLMIHTGAGYIGAEMKAQGHHIPLNAVSNLVAQAARSGQVVSVDDVRRAKDWLPQALLPDTCSEMAAPIVAEGKVVGVLDVQSDQVAGLDEGDANLLRSVANQVGVALTNAQLFEQTKRAKERAETANQAKSRFLANISHELRTPLNAILGFAQIMSRDATIPSQQRENLAIISRSGEHLLGLINDVLEISKIEAGQSTLTQTSFDLHYTLENLAEMVRARAEEKGLQLIFERAAEVPRYVKTDERKLRQILINLLSNAVKFTEAGGVTLRMTRGRLSLDTCLLYITVGDTGPGIAPAEMDKLFTPFFQAKSGQEAQEGTGLGLALSRQFAQLMGGDITVQSQVGQGSIFKVDIQVELAGTAEIKAGQPARRITGLVPDQPAYRILVVDDSLENRMLLSHLLAEVGFMVREVGNGQEAVELYQSWQPHLIWMDMRMPVMDGYEATKRIKASLQGQATAIIAVTASAFEEDRASILAAGCDDFVCKPFLEAEIFAKMAQHLGVRYVYEELIEPTGSTGRTLKQAALTPAALAVLPAEWVAKLRDAATRGKAKLIFDLLEQIEADHAPMAEAMRQLVRTYRFDKIVTLAEE